MIVDYGGIRSEYESDTIPLGCDYGAFQPNQGKKCLFAQLDRPTTNQSNVVCDVC